MATSPKNRTLATGTLPAADDLPGDLGESMYSLIKDLYPICRSITGNGVRESLKIVSDIVDLSVTEVPTGTRVFDWEVPLEWNISDAYIENASGDRVVDFNDSNLHVVSYSAPVNQVMTLEELTPHLHTSPDRPDWIPYRTSYYDENWGFCLAHRVFETFNEGQYKVVIDSELKPGSLTYAECVIQGTSDHEVIFFAHTCHPSLCNDNLSGVALATYLAKMLGDCMPTYTYRFIFAPATIGSITWLAQNEKKLSNIRHGMVLSNIGDSGHLVYKHSRTANSAIDRVVEHVLSSTTEAFGVQEFSPWGYDERQFCSPALNLPVGRLTRSPNGAYPEYHTSADDLTIVKTEFLFDSLSAVWRVIEVLEGNAVYLNKFGKGEPQLGRRGLYPKLGGYQDVEQQQLAMLWVLNQSDGKHSLFDIAEKSKLSFSLIRSAASDLIDADLLAVTDTECW
jgi:aminopeptidase-like protein